MISGYTNVNYYILIFLQEKGRKRENRKIIRTVNKPLHSKGIYIQTLTKNEKSAERQLRTFHIIKI